ncbi:expressed protein [Arabidopsis lyrata subsp. lyrata]|uniref:Expressed protein n=1 Tax=Arabidopsis lyrata subsp. lyrata TaxID=81972 RepID=D7KM26_ARALL|nr:expressed protein [Arabidopsis lyrata subsp. lyrata]
MSEQASLFQSSIRLLGEYCPISRKKSTHKVGGLRLGSFEAFNRNSTSFSGFQFMQPSDYHCLF